MIQAIVFDFDGLILDTETPEYLSFRQIYEQHGTELPLEIWGQCVGTDASGFDPYDYLEQQTQKPVNREQIREQRKENYQHLMRDEQIRPGVLAYLNEARRLNLRIGLASSSPQKWVIDYLTQFNIIEYFECIRVKEHVAKVKPDPELYIQVLQCLQVEPHQAIAFEDSPNGSLAAKRAGMHCVIVPNSITADFTFGAVDLRLNSMLDMSLTEVISQL